MMVNMLILNFFIFAIATNLENNVRLAASVDNLNGYSSLKVYRSRNDPAPVSLEPRLYLQPTKM